MAVFGAVPEFKRVSLRLTGLRTWRGAQQLQAFVRAARTRTGAPVEPWLAAYAQVGLPADLVPPHAALAQWAESPGGLPAQGGLADLANAYSLIHGLPVAAYDLSATRGGVRLRPSRGIERHTDLGGRLETPAIGELVLADDDDLVLARHWHGSPGREAFPVPETRSAVVHVDWLPGVVDLNPTELGTALLRLILAYFGGQGRFLILERDSPEASLADVAPHPDGAAP